MENWWVIQEMERMKHAEILKESKMKRLRTGVHKQSAKPKVMYITVGIVCVSTLYLLLLFAGFF